MSPIRDGRRSQTSKLASNTPCVRRLADDDRHYDEPRSFVPGRCSPSWTAQAQPIKGKSQIGTLPTTCPPKPDPGLQVSPGRLSYRLDRAP
jgi:hypothetical protein